MASVKSLFVTRTLLLCALLVGVVFSAAPITCSNRIYVSPNGGVVGGQVRACTSLFACSSETTPRVPFERFMLSLLLSVISNLLLAGNRNICHRARACAKQHRPLSELDSPTGRRVPIHFQPQPPRAFQHVLRRCNSDIFVSLPCFLLFLLSHARASLSFLCRQLQPSVDENCSVQPVDQHPH